MSHWKQYVVALRNGSRCSYCSQPIVKGTHIVEWAHGNTCWPKLHKSCVRVMYNTLKNSEANLNKEWEARQASAKIYEEKHQKALKETREKRGWKKAIVKSALQNIDVCVSKISLTNPNDFGTDGKGDLIKVAKKNRQQWKQPAFCWIQFDQQQITVFDPTNKNGVVTCDVDYWRGPSTQLNNYETIELADPKAIEKIGKAIQDLHKGDLTPFFKKKRKRQ